MKPIPCQVVTIGVRYVVDPSTFWMHVYSRRSISEGEEITVQYLSALDGTVRRRKKMRTEWHFECDCQR